MDEESLKLIEAEKTKVVELEETLRKHEAANLHLEQRLETQEKLIAQQQVTIEEQKQQIERLQRLIKLLVLALAVVTLVAVLAIKGVLLFATSAFLFKLALFLSTAIISLALLAYYFPWLREWLWWLGGYLLRMFGDYALYIAAGCALLTLLVMWWRRGKSPQARLHAALQRNAELEAQLQVCQERIKKLEDAEKAHSPDQVKQTKEPHSAKSEPEETTTSIVVEA